MNNEKQGLDLTTGNVPILLLKFALPMLVAGFLQMANIFITTIYVGRLLGDTCLAAVTMSMPIIFVLIAISNGFTLACSVLISQHMGRKDYIKTERIVQTSTLLIIIISLCIFTIGQIFTPLILKALGAEGEVLRLSINFMRILWFAIPFITIQALYTAMLRGIGNSTTALYFQSISIIIVLIFMPLVIGGSAALNLPAFGFEGGAFVMAAASVISTIAMGIHMQIAKYRVSPNWKELYMRKSILKSLTKIGLPAALQQAIVSIGMAVVLGIVANYGEEVIAAYGVASRIDNLAFLPAMSIGMAIASLTGQNLGAGKVDRVNTIFQWGMLYCLVFTLTASALAYFVPHIILTPFLKEDESAEVLRVGISYLKIVGLAYPFFALTFISNGVINGAGKTIVITILSLFNLWILRVPLAWYLSNRMDSEVGIWYTLAISFAFASILSFLYYKFGNWKKEFIKKEEPISEIVNVL